MSDNTKEDDFLPDEIAIGETRFKVKWSVLQYMLVGAREGGSEDWVNQIIVNEPKEGTKFPVEMDLQVDAPDVELGGFDESDPWTVYNSPFVDGGSLTLKHDHRTPEGESVGLHWYGGDTTTAGTETRQEFPVDDFSIELFNAGNAAVSTTNVWAVEVHPGRIYAYELRRANRHLRVEFDLTRPVAG